MEWLRGVAYRTIPESLVWFFPSRYPFIQFSGYRKEKSRTFRAGFFTYNISLLIERLDDIKIMWLYNIIRPFTNIVGFAFEMAAKRCKVSDNEMKILIAYAGKSGTTAKCAGLLAEQLNGEDVEVVDLCAKKPDIDGCDIVVIGSNIHVGQIHKNVILISNKKRFKLAKEMV